MNTNKSNRSHRVSFRSDVDSLTNHKTPPSYQTQLSIVEESENPETHHRNNGREKRGHLEDIRVPTPNSSVENLSSSTKHSRAHLSPNDADSHEKEPLNNSSRRPSIQALQVSLKT